MMTLPYGGPLIASPNEDPIWVWQIDAAVVQNLVKEVNEKISISDHMAFPNDETVPFTRHRN